MKSVRNSSAGFSLVELMVVVAIIGILATIAVPQVNKFMARARQSEAKGNLSTMFSTQKAFYAEYTTYYAGFNTVGFSPEGDLRYRVGFTNEHGVNAAALTAAGYRMTGAVALHTNSDTYCNAAATLGCTSLADATGAPMPESALTGDTFIATASSNSIGYNVNDRWTINERKRVENRATGIQ